MSEMLQRILTLIRAGDVQISLHGYEELAEDDIYGRDILEGAPHGSVVEEYREYPKGPCVLVLQWDREDKPIHGVRGVPRRFSAPAVLITA